MRKMALVLAGLVVLAGTACSSNAKANNPGTTVNVDEGDMFLKPSTTTFPAGQVTFVVTNGGKVHHEFVIVSGDPTGTTGDEEGRVSEENHLGGDEGPEIGDVAPGQTKSLDVRLPAGTYTAMCNLPGHFAAGMHFSFTVT